MSLTKKKIIKSSDFYGGKKKKEDVCVFCFEDALKLGPLLSSTSQNKERDSESDSTENTTINFSTKIKPNQTPPFISQIYSTPENSSSRFGTKEAPITDERIGTMYTSWRMWERKTQLRGPARTGESRKGGWC